MNEKAPTPTPDPRSNVFTAEDGVRLASMISREIKALSVQLGELGGAIAILTKNIIEIMEDVTVIESGLSTSRVGRLEIELREAELEKETAERNLRAIEKKLELKRTVRDEQVDTHEKVKQAAAAALSDLQKQKQETDEAFRIDLRRQAIKAAVFTLSATLTAGAIAFIVWLFRLYVAGGP